MATVTSTAKKAPRPVRVDVSAIDCFKKLKESGTPEGFLQHLRTLIREDRGLTAEQAYFALRENEQVQLRYLGTLKKIEFVMAGKEIPLDVFANSADAGPCPDWWVEEVDGPWQGGIPPEFLGAPPAPVQPPPGVPPQGLLAPLQRGTQAQPLPIGSAPETPALGPTQVQQPAATVPAAGPANGGKVAGGKAQPPQAPAK